MARSGSLAARPDAVIGWRAAALLGIVAITLWRVVWLAHDATELSTDEAQYWFWGQSFALGGYSKPPLIGWIIGAVTTVLPDSVFSVRLAAPVLHGATATVVLILSARLLPERVAALAALTYATLPSVALGSALMTVDTPLLLCIALALLLQHQLAAGAGRGAAVALGAVLALGLLAKYAMIYAIGAMCLAALVDRTWRVPRDRLGLVVLVCVLGLVPHAVWLTQRDFVIFDHLAATAQWTGPSLHLLVALRFVAEQFAVAGPMVFAVWLLALWRLRQLPDGLRGLMAGSATILAVVVVQALAGRALANWGVGFVVAGVIVAAWILDHHPRVMLASLLLGGVVSLGLPVVKVVGTDLVLPDGRRMLYRYLGHAEVSLRAIDFARQTGARVILSGDRALLADLAWTGRTSDIAVMAAPVDTAPRHHWDMAHRFDPAAETGPVVLLAEPAPCTPPPLARDDFTAGPGFAQGRPISLLLLPARCFAKGSNP